MSLYEDFLKQIAAHITRGTSKRDKVVVGALFVCAVLTYIVLYQRVTLWQVLAVSAWLIIAAWYLVLFSRKRARSTKALVILITIIWVGALVFELSSSTRRVGRLMTNAAFLKDNELFQESLSEFGRALDAARSSGLRTEELKCLFELGDINYLLDDTSRAKEYLEGCRALATEIKDTKYLGRSLIRLADIENMSGNRELARQHYEEAGEIFRQENDQAWQAQALRGFWET